MAFSGWAEEALDFYEGLEADNTKTYWTRQKAVYEDKVLRPMMELLDELGPEFGESKIFRPYRDVRFSKDKTPYKTHMGVIAEIEKQGVGVHGRDVLKTVPRGYPADHLRAGLLRYKGIVAWREWPPGPWLETLEARERIAGFLRAARPLGDWLTANVGPSTMERPAR